MFLSVVSVWCVYLRIVWTVEKSCSKKETNFNETWLILEGSTVVYQNHWNGEGMSGNEIFVLGINNEESELKSCACRNSVWDERDEGEWITEPTEEGCVNATASDGQNVPIVIVLIGIQVICHVIGVVEVVVAANDGEKRTRDNWSRTLQIVWLFNLHRELVLPS